MSTKTRLAVAIRTAIPEGLDLRTTEDIEAEIDATAESLRERLYGLPARPGTRR